MCWYPWRAGYTQMPESCLAKCPIEMDQVVPTNLCSGMFLGDTTTVGPLILESLNSNTKFCAKWVLNADSCQPSTAKCQRIFLWSFIPRSIGRILWQSRSHCLALQIFFSLKIVLWPLGEIEANSHLLCAWYQKDFPGCYQWPVIISKGTLCVALEEEIGSRIRSFFHCEVPIFLAKLACFLGAHMSLIIWSFYLLLEEFYPPTSSLSYSQAGLQVQN